MTLTPLDRLALAALYAVLVWLLLTGCTPRRPECPGDDGPDGECGCPCHDAEPLR